MGPLSPLQDTLFFFALLWGLFFMFKAFRSKVLVIGLVLWSILHMALAASGFHAAPDALPPRPLFALGPLVVLMGLALLIPRGRAFLLRADLLLLTSVHILRVPVELFLHDAWQAGLAPRAMTWSGSNFDILSGISAAAMVAYLLRSKAPSRRLLIIWNVIALLLLINVVVIAMLSFPSPIQQLNFDTPLLLPQDPRYILLPATIVPIVLLAHVAALIKLWTSPAPLAPSAALY